MQLDEEWEAIVEKIRTGRIEKKGNEKRGLKRLWKNKEDEKGRGERLWV